MSLTPLVAVLGRVSMKPVSGDRERQRHNGEAAFGEPERTNVVQPFFEEDSLSPSSSPTALNSLGFNPR